MSIDIPILDLLEDCGLTRSEARRRIATGAVRLCPDKETAWRDWPKCTDTLAVLSLEFGTVLRFGKKWPTDCRVLCPAMIFENMPERTVSAEQLSKEWGLPIEHPESGEQIISESRLRRWGLAHLSDMEPFEWIDPQTQVPCGIVFAGATVYPAETKNPSIVRGFREGVA